MKKVIFVLVALLTLVFTGCKVETSKVTVSVEDKLGTPLANRYVFYIDYATYILSEAFPSPEELATGVSEDWEVAKTNAYGTVELEIRLGVSKLQYCFVTYDMGTMKWVEKDVELKRGQNADIEFVVNQ